ncbi:MAG: hypothetical protein O2865_14335 [Planctomycetota bacterium]|nr:hypothetical protein [Planctomycetota bacterium]
MPERGFADYRRTTKAWRVAPAENTRRGDLVRPVDAGSAWKGRAWPQSAIADGFQVRDYDDSGWTDTRLPVTPSDAADAPWPLRHRVLDARAMFDSPPRAKAMVLTVEHGDNVEIWLNGVRIGGADVTGQRKKSDFVLTPDQIGLLERSRPNVLAVQIRNPDGPCFLSVELVSSSRSFGDGGNATSRLEQGRQVAANLQRDLFDAWRGAPAVTWGELDPSRTRLRMTPVDLRELGSYVGFDLQRAGRRGKLSYEIPLTWRFGDVRLKGDADGEDDSGRQRLELEVVSGAPDERRYEKRYYKNHISHWWEYTFAGELVVDRAFDEDRGVITWMETRLTGTVKHAHGGLDGQAFDVEFVEEWTLAATRPDRDGQFLDDVVAAIERGREFLKRELADMNKPALQAGGDNRTYPSGKLALALLALIHCDLPRDDPILVKGLDELRRRKLVDTYSVANAIMALEAYYQPRGEYEELRAGMIEKPRPRQLPEADLELMKEWAGILLNNMDSRVDPAYLARWSYVREGRYDHSVNQYGLLGLYSAQLCGVQISPTLWKAAAAHLVDAQEKPESRTQLEITTHRQLETIKSGGDTSTGTRPVGLAGWGYVEAEHNGEPRPIYGSMTCAGLTGLTIAMAGMVGAGLTRDITLSEAANAQRSGFAWLAERFSTRFHPGPGLHANYFTHILYYLYGLERSCELSGVALLNGRDWYLEGALTLLSLQKDDGTWPNATGGETDAITVTSMALLFLKKSSMPVYTQK